VAPQPVAPAEYHLAPTKSTALRSALPTGERGKEDSALRKEAVGVGDALEMDTDL